MCISTIIVLDRSGPIERKMRRGHFDLPNYHLSRRTLRAGAPRCTKRMRLITAYLEERMLKRIRQVDRENFMKTIIWSALLIAASVTAHASTWSLADNFSYSTNPGGQWSYGWSTTPSGKFMLDKLFEAILYNTSGGSVTGWRGDSY